MNNATEYLTKDVGEAAALLSGGCYLKTIQWKDNFAYFIFADPKGCATRSHDYFYGELMVNARVFHDTLRMIKRKLYASDPRGGKWPTR